MKTIKTTRKIPTAPGSEFRIPNSEFRTAFTLVEMLIIVAIIMLLTGLLFPAMNAFRQSIKSKLTQSNIHLIATACDLYANDFDGELPPSEDSGWGSPRYFEDNNDRYGKKIIVLLLTGYAGDDDDAGEPYEPGSETMSQDDGRDGFGFRTVQRGKIYGPYNGTEKIPTTTLNGGHPVFADAFGNAILYYRADTTGAFSPTDNKKGGVDALSAEKLQPYEDAHMPYLIISAGKDGEFGEDDNGINDDITNQ